MNQTRPRACYDEGKRVAETLTYGYHYQDKVDVRVARIFNTYGQRMNPFDGRVMSNFLIQALQGKPLTIYGDGSQTRSFCFIHDLVDGLIALMNAAESKDAEILASNGNFEFKDCKLEELNLCVAQSKHGHVIVILRLREPNFAHEEARLFALLFKLLSETELTSSKLC